MFYVYDNNTHNRARIHTSACHTMRNGGGSENGDCHGPFDTYEEAKAVMATLSKLDKGDCAICHPVEED